ncbi:Diacylglycerol O-acyltransferase 2 [Zea mays]|uniref:Acyltransferase n=1 Tax=Zea mays TaxID=4577 RepID=A0A1D6NZV7_MAIZE|nr:Diacylglycerol O-acyltransferase 2 [Zea mays]
MGADGGLNRAAEKPRDGEGGEARVFRCTDYSLPRTTLALALWLGGIHFNVLLVLASLFLLSGRAAAIVVAFQLLFMFAPVNDRDKWGQSVARFICRHAMGYFPITLHVEDYKSLDPSRAYGMLPKTCFSIHGCCSHRIHYPIHKCPRESRKYQLQLLSVKGRESFICRVGLSALADLVGFLPLTKIKVLASSAVFYTPFLRQIWTWLGLVPATRKNFYCYLGAGYSCIVVPGGVREMLHMNNDSEVAFLKSRKGFVKIAIQSGCPLVPVFCFGQIIFHGLLTFECSTPFPFPKPMHVVVGKPIEVNKIPHPTIDEINEVHEQFIIAMRDLFEKYKAKAGYPGLHLRVL